jgi:hypothetical protein
MNRQKVSENTLSFFNVASNMHLVIDGQGQRGNDLRVVMGVNAKHDSVVVGSFSAKKSLAV